MNPYFVEEMSNVLDEEKKVKHSALANKVDSQLDNTKFWQTVELPSKQKMPSDFDPSQLDWTHGPIIQSGGKFDLKMNAVVDDELLHVPGLAQSPLNRFGFGRGPCAGSSAGGVVTVDCPHVTRRTPGRGGFRGRVEPNGF